MGKNDDNISFFSKKLYFKKTWVAIFADIIKILTMFIKTILKDSRKFRRVRKYLSKWNLPVFLDIAKFADLR